MVGELRSDALAAGDGALDGHRSDVGRGGQPAEDVRPPALVARAAEVVGGTLPGRVRVRRPSLDPMDEAPQAPQAPETQVVAGPLECLDQRLEPLPELVRARLGVHLQPKTELRHRRVRLGQGVVPARGDLHRGVEEALGVRQPSHLGQRRSELGHEQAHRRVVVRQQRGRSLEQVDRRRHVVTRQRPASGASQVVGPSARERPVALAAGRLEREMATEGLLQVVARQLLVLAELVVRALLEPAGVTLVKLGAALLRARCCRWHRGPGCGQSGRPARWRTPSAPDGSICRSRSRSSVASRSWRCRSGSRSARAAR